MATFKELNFLLSLDPVKFLDTAKKASQEFEQTKQKVQTPLELRARIEGVITTFAKVGLAIQGLQQTYNLLLNPIRESINLANIQERADTQLTAALQAKNLNTQANIDLLKTQASAIQQVTVVGDEQSNMLQALALNMGVTFERVDEVTRGAIGLSTSFAAAGVSQEQALKAIARAYQRNFEAVQEFIPAIRNAKDESEKMAILQQTMRDGFNQAEAAAKSNAGQMQQFANLTGDAKEKVGQLISEALVPLLRIFQPLLEAFVGMDAGVRNAGLATVAFLGIASRVPATLTAIRAAVIALNASMGPTGWLILGIGAAATALGIYAASAGDAEAANAGLETSNIGVADSFDQVTQAAFQELKTSPSKDLIDLRSKLNQELDANYEKLKQINAELGRTPNEEELLFQVTFIGEEPSEENAQRNLKVQQEIEQQRTEIIIKETKARITAIDALLKERQEIELRNSKPINDEEIRRIDQLRQYEFQSHRISLAEYIAYLESRREAVRTKSGEESAEYLQFVDRLAELRRELVLQTADERFESVIFPDTAEIRARSQEILDITADFYDQLAEYSTLFSEESFADLEAQYNGRLLLSDLNLRLLEQSGQKESEAYRKELAKRLEMERNFQNAKISLMEKGALAAISIGAGLMQAFQGQSKTLFDVGKALSIAQATIDAYQAIARAFKDYPWPFNIAVAAIQGALAFAQVAKISAVNFEPKGKKEGGLITQADIVQSLFTPAGEDGIIGIQRFEYVMNRQATARFLPILEEMNKIGRSGAAPRQAGKIPGFQEGGLVTSPGKELPAESITREDFERMVEAIRDIQINIRPEIDAQKFFRDNFPAYQKQEKRRTII